MPRIAGIDIPNEKRAIVALQYIHGIGPAIAKRIIEATGINPATRARDLTEDETKRIAIEIEQKYTVEGALRRLVTSNVQRLKDIGCYRGMRHRKGLPARGQRTKTNSRTRKGKAKTVAVKRSVKAMR
ncbi:MAG: 30S ribosomal protein S13 [Planctomycetes bacterium]|nr:30S ribosomal protein S13 [Planctomycetota bacterium]MCW8138917.1 30S ribosomal protein S13 [Planctomycetota bacterium]